MLTAPGGFQIKLREKEARIDWGRGDVKDMLKDFDINLAMLKKHTCQPFTADSDKERGELYKKEVEQFKARISRFTFERIAFCNGLFSMLMPSELFGQPIVMGNLLLFQSSKEKMTLSIKVIESEQIVKIDQLQHDYVSQMRSSRQQTKIDISDARQAAFGTIYYFTAIHSMPGGALCDFIILFQGGKKMIFMDFNFEQKEYCFWKTILCKLSSTIEMEGGPQQ